MIIATCAKVQASVLHTLQNHPDQLCNVDIQINGEEEKDHCIKVFINITILDDEFWLYHCMPRKRIVLFQIIPEKSAKIKLESQLIMQEIKWLDFV